MNIKEQLRKSIEKGFLKLALSKFSDLKRTQEIAKIQALTDSNTKSKLESQLSAPSLLEETLDLSAKPMKSIPEESNPPDSPPLKMMNLSVGPSLSVPS